MKQQVEIILGSLREEIASRKKAVHLLEEDIGGLQHEIDKRKAAIAKLHEEIAQISQVSEVLGKSALGDVRALLSPDELPPQETLGGKSFYLHRDYASVFVKALLYLGYAEWFTLKQIMAAVEELELVAPYQYRIMRTEPGKLAARQEFPILERKRKSSSGVLRYIYHLTEPTSTKLGRNLGDLNVYRGNPGKVKELSAGMLALKKAGIPQPTAA